MITCFWAVGIGFTILIFAGKAGLVAGSVNLRIWQIMVLSLVYALLAFLMGVGLKIVNPLDYFAFFQKFMAYGVAVHFLLSLGLVAWGVYTMRTVSSGQMMQRSKIGYALMIPCPICLSAMLLSCSIFVALTGIDSLKAGGLMAALFMVVIAGVGLLAKYQMTGNRKGKKGGMLLGFIMVMAGLYFAVSIVVIPVYAKAKALFLNSQTVVGSAGLSPEQGGILAGLVALVLGLGFLRDRKRM